MRGVACALVLGGGVLWGPQVAEARKPPLVPQAMIDACAAFHAGDACRFELSGRAIEGVCAPLPDEVLACRPGGKGKAKGPAPKQ